jgi:hypothetical protein
MHSGAGAQVEDQVNWPEFIGRHDLTWSELPDEWGEGALLGNGLLGANIWAAQDETLHWDLGRSDVYDKGNRIPMGKFIMHSEGAAKDFSMTQSLWNAEATGTIRTEKGSVRFRSMVPRQSMVVLIETVVEGREKARFDLQLDPASWIPPLIPTV